jgi:hypothetical protein
LDENIWGKTQGGRAMTENEIGEKLEELRKGMHLFDSIVYQDWKTGEGSLNEKQVEIVRELLKLFKKLNWQISFNAYKELKYDGTEPIDKRRCGTPVKVRSCRKEHDKKTYFGILLGDVALSISHSINDDGTVTAEHSMYNPAIFVPELNDIVYGCESWWSKIESEEELSKLITDETIKNVWYVKLLNEWEATQ